MNPSPRATGARRKKETMRHIGTVITKPRWKDPGTCKDCVYLGEFGLYDLYCCTRPDHPTVIATCEADDGNYKSGIMIAPYDPELGEALKRATKAGLLAGIID